MNTSSLQRKDASAKSADGPAERPSAPWVSQLTSGGETAGQAPNTNPARAGKATGGRRRAQPLPSRRAEGANRKDSTTGGVRQRPTMMPTTRRSYNNESKRESRTSRELFPVKDEEVLQRSVVLFQALRPPHLHPPRPHFLLKTLFQPITHPDSAPAQGKGTGTEGGSMRAGQEYDRATIALQHLGHTIIAVTLCRLRVREAALVLHLKSLSVGQVPGLDEKIPDLGRSQQK